jgi:hypothetical protein
MDNKPSINVATILIWMLMYLFVCGVVPHLMGRMIDKVFASHTARWINFLILSALNIGFLYNLTKRYEIELEILKGITVKTVILSLVFSLLFFLFIDMLLDPFLEDLFPSSTKIYYENVNELSKNPVLMFFRVCLLAPITEELLIRGCILNSLSERYSSIIAIAVSALIFALLHFNFIQTVSAVIFGIFIGIAYVKSHSLFLCILTHGLYNLISYIYLRTIMLKSQ